jgi:hypothetical protein
MSMGGDFDRDWAAASKQHLRDRADADRAVRVAEHRSIFSRLWDRVWPRRDKNVPTFSRPGGPRQRRRGVVPGWF